MKFARKLKRKKLKQDAKNLKAAVKGVARRMDSLGENCRSCNKFFDRNDSENLMAWSVYVVDGKPNLICPQCRDEIEKMKQEQREEMNSVRVNEEGSAEVMENA